MSGWRLVAGSGIPGADAIHSDGARNMAVDDVLFDAAKRGGPATLRFYRWTPACLSLGRNQPARGRYDANAPEPGRDIVRRPTGGLAVYHDDEVTYSLACAVGVLGTPRETFLRVHRAIARGLASLGVPAEIAPLGARAPDPGDPIGICFRAPAHGEILAAAGKLVGSAQRTEDRTVLQHGSILVEGSQDRAAADRSSRSGLEAHLRARSVAVVGDGTPHGQITLTSLLGRRPDDPELTGAIRAAFEAELGIRLAPASLSADEMDRLPEAERRYRSDEWTWRS